MEGVADSVSQDRLRGIRIFDVTDVAHPKYITNVQTCRGSHTHTVVTDPKDDAERLHLHLGFGRRPFAERARGLLGVDARQGPEQLALPDRSHQGAAGAPGAGAGRQRRAHFRGAHESGEAWRARGRRRGGRSTRGGSGSRRTRRPRPAPPPGTAPGPTQCHDITVYPQIGLAGGACGGYGLLLDIRDVSNPKRIAAAADSNFSFWHSATFNNDGTKVLFSDEWGGGTQPRCRVTDKLEWGADAIFTITLTRRLTFQSYYKMPAPQTVTENCVAHNGSLIPIPGRDVMVQAWYQGGLSMFDWTDGAHPKEIAYFDRGPMDAKTLVRRAATGRRTGTTATSLRSEIARGLDIFALKPSAFISQNEIDAAKSVHFAFFNAQDQPKFVWPATFALSRSYVDQLERSSGLSAGRIGSVRSSLAAAEKLNGDARKSSLSSLASAIDGDAPGSHDAAKVRMLAASVRELSNASR